MTFRSESLDLSDRLIISQVHAKELDQAKPDGLGALKPPPPATDIPYIQPHHQASSV